MSILLSCSNRVLSQIVRIIAFLCRKCDDADLTGSIICQVSHSPKIRDDLMPYV